MSGYDRFSVGDRGSLWVESLVSPYRRETIEALGDCAGGAVLDLACGEGENFDHWRLGSKHAPAWVIGVDASIRKLREAHQRVRQGGWKNAVLLQTEDYALEQPLFSEYWRSDGFDGVVCTLGLTALQDWEQVFSRSFSLLKPGGRFAILDRYTSKDESNPASEGTSPAPDFTRRVWESLERACDDFQMRFLDASPRALGGNLYLASGRRKLIAH
ncbi:methyltransferase domain-containing protein [Myxococcota bacterium]|nr:methyltransferase domain-containing protein [Myxococcota bacterium]